MRVNKRKGYRDIGFGIMQSSYHDKRYILIHLYKICIEIELGDTFPNDIAKEIHYGIKYSFGEKALHINWHRRGKCILF